MSVKRAALTYNVPVTTLRDRVLGKVHHESAVHGKSPLFTRDEEFRLKNHFKTMASLGYGYTRSECVDIATDFAVQIGKRQKDNPLTIKWIRGFLKRWPEIKLFKPRGLEYARARMASEAVVTEFFENLKNTLEEHDFMNNPHLIFNVDEKGLTVNHQPPLIVASSDFHPQAVTSGKGKTVTVIGGISASGSSIPPFFIFPGKRMNPQLLNGKSPGADGTVSESGWSNLQIFRQYLSSHFLKYVPGREGQKVLLLLDGHTTHVSVGLCEWASQHGIVLFILPAHTSHLLQPLDVACYGPFQRMYNAECHKLIKQTAATINRFNVCETACKVYSRALSSENAQSGFKRTGIYPLNKEAVPKEFLIPAEVYCEENDNCSQDTVPGGIVINSDTLPVNIFQEKENNLRQIKSRLIKKPRKTISKIVSGKEISPLLLENMKDHEKEQKKNVKKVKSEVKFPENTSKLQPGPSHINLVPDSDTDSYFESDKEEDLCCVCNKFTPEEVSKSASIIFVKWAQCDGFRNGQPCKHWVHLKFCTSVKILRRGDSFFCHHCKKEE